MICPEKIDTLLEARWIIPVEPAGVALRDHAVAINRGMISAIVPNAEAHARFAPDNGVA